MASHPELQKFLDGKQKTHSGATAGVETLTAPNVNFSHQELMELLHTCKAMGLELQFTAGALKIRPKDSTL